MSETQGRPTGEDFQRVAAAWGRWWPILERRGRAVSERLVRDARIGRGARVLDIATGLGEPALTAARAAGAEGHVLGIDISPAMIALAQDRAAREGVANVEYRVGDAETAELGGPYDAVLSRWGLMFAHDLDALLRRIRAALTPGGRLAAATWSTPERVPSIVLPMTLAAERGLAPPPAPVGPFALHDTDALRARLAAARFADIAIEPMPVSYAFDSPAQYVEHITAIAPPVIALLGTLDDAQRRELLTAIESAARERFRTPDGHVSFTNEAIIVSASTGG